MNIVIPIILILVVLFGFTAFTGAPYVPSLKSEIKKAFTKLYRISSKDFLIDLGAGDGIVNFQEKQQLFMCLAIPEI